MCEPGTKARMPSTSTSTPPLMTPVTSPSMMRLVVEGLLDDRLRALGTMRMVREHHQAAARAVVVHDGDEVRAHLEGDAGDLGLTRRRRRLGIDGHGRRRCGAQPGFRVGSGAGAGAACAVGSGLGSSAGAVARLPRVRAPPPGLRLRRRSDRSPSCSGASGAAAPGLSAAVLRGASRGTLLVVVREGASRGGRRSPSTCRECR